MLSQDSTSVSSSPLRSQDHDRGLHEVDACVVSLSHPCARTLRVGAELATSADDPGWTAPNVAFRIQLEEEGRSISRIYTARAFSPALARVEFDVVLHGADSPMMRWAAAAQVGRRLRLIGPRANITIPRSKGRPVALFLDDSAIPALHSILQQWPQGITGTGWIATEDTHALAELPRVPGLQLHRLPAQADVLLHQARQLADPCAHIVWGAGERDEMRAIRQYFHAEAGLAKEDVAIAGYWKRGASNTEIDARRQDAYRQFLAAGGTLAEWDDLAIAI